MRTIGIEPPILEVPLIALRPQPVLFSLVLTAIVGSIAWADEPRLLSTCSNCWPLSGAHPGSFMAPDGSGGMYVVWMDGNLQWRLQRLGPDLSAPSPWPADG